MNNIFKVVGASILTVLTLGVTSCSNEEPLIFNPETAVSPAFTSTLDESYTLKSDNADASFNKFTFAAADFGMQTATEYTLQLALASDTKFATAQKIWAGITLEADVLTSKLNTAILAINEEALEPTDVIFRVKAIVMGPNGATDAYVMSNNQASTITPYSSDLDLATLPRVWAIGDYCGWDFGKASQIHNYAKDDVLFEGIIDFDAQGLLDKHKAGSFKLSGAPEWSDADGNWGLENESTELEPASITLFNSGGSKNIAGYKANRFYKFQFDKTTEVLTKVSSFNSMGIIGNAGNWDTDVVLNWDPQHGRFWVDITLSGDGIKFRSDGSWNGVILGGTLEALGAGDNIVVPKGNYRVYLYMSTSKVYAELDAKRYGTN